MFNFTGKVCVKSKRCWYAGAVNTADICDGRSDSILVSACSSFMIDDHFLPQICSCSNVLTVSELKN